MGAVSNWPVQALRVSSPLTTLKLFFFFFFFFFSFVRGEYTLRIYTVATFIDARPPTPDPSPPPLSSLFVFSNRSWKRLNLTSYFSIIPGTRPYITHLDTQAESPSESKCSLLVVLLLSHLKLLIRMKDSLDFSMELKYTVSNLFIVSLSSCELLFPQLDWQIRFAEAAKLYIYVRVIVNPVSECSAASKSDGVSSLED